MGPDAEHVLARHEQGMAARDIAAEIGSSYGKVAALLRARGIEPHLAKRGPRGPAPEVQAEAVRLQLQGLAAAEVAARLGISTYLVRKALERAGVDVPPAPRGRPRHVLTPESAERALSLYDAGSRIPDVAAEVGVSSSVVRQLLLDSGRTIRRGPRRAGADERAARIAEAFNAGRTLQEIADEHGITRVRVQQILAKQGLNAKNRELAPAERRAAAFDAEHGEAVRASLNETHDVRSTATTLALDPADVRAFAKRQGIRLRRSLAPRPAPQRLWSREDGVTALQQMWEQLGRPEQITGRQHVDWWRAHREGPSPATVIDLFGSWQSAVAAAGLSTPERRVRSDRQSDEQLWDALRTFVDAAGEEGKLTGEAYAEWAKAHGKPSLVLLRKRLLRDIGWAEALRRVLEQSH